MLLYYHYHAFDVMVLIHNKTAFVSKARPPANKHHDPMTFKCGLDSYSVEIYGMCGNELPTSRLSKVIVLQPANACI